MKADWESIQELINIGEWSLLEFKQDRHKGSGISHVPCEGWIRFGMRHDYLFCRDCRAPIPNNIVTIWLLLNSDKKASSDYYKKYAGVEE